jgi:hypothetical protein
VEVLRAAVAESPAKREAEEVEHPPRRHRLGFCHQVRVLLLFLCDPQLHLARQQFLAVKVLRVVPRRRHSLRL